MMPVIDPKLLLYVKDAADWAASNDPLVFEKQIIYCDEFKKWDQATGKLLWELTVTEDTIDEWCQQNVEMREAGVGVPLPVGHAFGPDDKRGDVLELYKKLDGKGRVSLYAKVKFTTLENANKYKHSNVSMFAPPMFKHQDKTWVRPITHVAITDYPVIGDLEGFIAASNEVSTPNMDYLKKIAEKLGLTVEDGATEDEVLAMIDEAITALQDGEPDPNADPATDPAAASVKPPVAASHDPVIISLSRDNRAMKIDKLLDERKVTPAQAKLLRTQYVDGFKGGVDGFDAAYNLALSNEPISALSGGESSGAQRKSGTAGKIKSKLVQDAQKRSGKA